MAPRPLTFVLAAAAASAGCSRPNWTPPSLQDSSPAATVSAPRAASSASAPATTSAIAPPAGDDPCAGMVSDLLPHHQTPLKKPALGEVVVDAEFHTKIRRITEATPNEGNVVKPMYATMPTWNADESLMILLGAKTGHQLYDGKTYKRLRALDIAPSDIEHVYWHVTDPDVLFYPERGSTNFIRYHVKDGRKEVLTSFPDVCPKGTTITAGGDPMFTSWDSTKIGLACGSWTSDWKTYTGKVFLYDIAANKVLGVKQLRPGPSTPNPPSPGPSGTLAYLEEDSGVVVDTDLKELRKIKLKQPYNHASLGRLLNGHDAWNGAVYDPFAGNADKDDVGILVTWDLVTAEKRVIIGPATGYPYPPDGHISAMAIKRPGWVVVSTLSANKSGQQGLLDQEILFANTSTGKVCRIGRHRSWGKGGPQGYWAEADAVPSPSGTRVAFASDWGGGQTVDTYVIELPGYTP